MRIRPNDLVLEIGGGDNPYPRSDVLLDKFPDDDCERVKGRGVVCDRPFVVADAEALPFADKSFDYIIVANVLEHAQNPANFLDELSRVGKRGYIETPLPLKERIIDFPFHRWFINQKGKNLVLIKKTFRRKKFYSGMSNEKRRDLFHLAFGENLLQLKYEWQDKINYKIIPSEPEEFLREVDAKLAKFLQKKETETKYWLQKLKFKLLLIPGVADANLFVRNCLFSVKKTPGNILARLRRKNIDFLPLLVCPVCKEKLEVTAKSLNCPLCKRKFPFYRNKFPKLLIWQP